MNKIPPRPCQDCGVLVASGANRCAAHERAAVLARVRHRRTAPGDGAAVRLRALYLREPSAYACAVCRAEGVKMAVDHRLALVAGGSDYADNVQLLCVPCHKVKSAGEAAERGAVVPHYMRHKEEY